MKGLCAAPLPLFKAADAHDGKLSAEAIEPHVALMSMSEGQATVEDYHTIGLALRAHPGEGAIDRNAT